MELREVLPLSGRGRFDTLEAPCKPIGRSGVRVSGPGGCCFRKSLIEYII